MKKIIRLTESDIRRMVMEAIQAMPGMDPETYEDQYTEEEKYKRGELDDQITDDEDWIPCDSPENF